MEVGGYLEGKGEGEKLGGGKRGKIVVRVDCEKLGKLGIRGGCVYVWGLGGDKVGSENEIGV